MTKNVQKRNITDLPETYSKKYDVDIIMKNTVYFKTVMTSSWHKNMYIRIVV